MKVATMQTVTNLIVKFTIQNFPPAAVCICKAYPIHQIFPNLNSSKFSTIKNLVV